MYLFVVCVCVYTSDLCIVFIFKIIAVHHEKQEAGEGWCEL